MLVKLQENQYALKLFNSFCLVQIEGKLWELRPIPNRVFFATLEDNHLILLHQFRKKTQKTPKREIEQAKRELNDWLERKKG